MLWIHIFMYINNDRTICGSVCMVSFIFPRPSLEDKQTKQKTSEDILYSLVYDSVVMSLYEKLIVSNNPEYIFSCLRTISRSQIFEK